MNETTNGHLLWVQRHGHLLVITSRSPRSDQPENFVRKKTHTFSLEACRLHWLASKARISYWDNRVYVILYTWNPKCPLFRLEKIFFLEAKQRTNPFQVYIIMLSRLQLFFHLLALAHWLYDSKRWELLLDEKLLGRDQERRSPSQSSSYEPSKQGRPEGGALKLQHSANEHGNHVKPPSTLFHLLALAHWLYDSKRWELLLDEKLLGRDQERRSPSQSSSYEPSTPKKEPVAVWYASLTRGTKHCPEKELASQNWVV